MKKIITVLMVVFTMASVFAKPIVLKSDVGFLVANPFFIKENWLTLTKEEWNKMAKDFLENN